MGIITMSPADLRETALMNFYRAERNAGACPITATERMGEFAKRLDYLQLEYVRQLEIVKQCMERT